MLYSHTIKLIKTYQGADGLKTGYTDDALYCMAVTAKRNNMRLLAITLGEESGKVRNQETTELLDYGFNLYEISVIKEKGEVIGSIEIDKANISKIDIITSKDVVVLKKQSDDDINYKTSIKLNNLKLPIKAGDNIGSLIIKDEYSNKIDEVLVTVSTDIKKDNFFNIYFKVIKSIINGELFGYF